MKIMHYIGSNHQRRIGIGNIMQIAQTIYFRSKEMGYDDVYMEWPIRVTCGPEYGDNKYMPSPKELIIPIKFINRGEWSTKDFDKVIDLTEKDSLYDGFIPLWKGKDIPLRNISYLGIENYVNMYLEKTKKRPIFNIPKDKLEKPYILFHFRNSEWSSYRNSNPYSFRKIYNILNEKYRDKYNFIKCGEKFRALDRLFDKVTPYYDNFNDILKIVNNSTLFIGAAAGMLTFAQTFDIPHISLDEPKYGKDGKGHSNREEEYWKGYGGYGKSYCDWVDDNKTLVFWKEEGPEFITSDKVLEFCGKYL
jgi:ADP-heptose:LPS heptosyltransferase